eukprot:gene27673-7314_t
MLGNSILDFLGLFAVDIRTERCLRFCLICAVCFVIYFYWDMNGKCMLYQGGQCLYFLTYDARTYWSMLRFLAGQLTMFPHYHTGWTFGLLSIAYLTLAMIGMLLMAIVPALVHSAWAGYLTICAAYVIVFGPLFASNSPVPANAVGLIGGIFLDFMYVPLVEPLQTSAAGVVDNHLIWAVGINLLSINIALFLAISIGAYLIPPFRSARVHLHSKAHMVISALADGYDHMAEHLLDGSSKYEAMLKPGTVDRALVSKYLGAGSIQMLSAQAMLEPSLLHPATLSALPGVWDAFLTQFYASEYQLHLLYRCLLVAQPSGTARQLTGESTKAVNNLLRVIAESLRLERRGKHDLPLLDFTPLLVGCEASREAKTRQELQDKLEGAQEAGRESLKHLGRYALSSSISTSHDAASDADIFQSTMGAFLLLCRSFKQTSQPTAPVTALLEGKDPKKETLFKRIKGKMAKKPTGLPHVDASHYAGIGFLTKAMQTIQEKISTMSMKNILLQLFIVGGGLTLVGTISTWIKCASSIIKAPYTLIVGRRGDVYRQPINIYHFIQLIAGVFCMFALATFSSEYRNWQNADDHGATWPLLAFLLVIQPTTEASLQKGVLRIVGTIAGTLLAWGFLSVSLSGSWLIPMSVLALSPAFWLMEAPMHTSFPLRWWEPISYVGTAYSFGYIMVMSYGGYSFTVRSAVISRLVTQVLGACIAMFLSTFLFPVSAVALSTCFAEEAMVELDSVACMLQAIVAPRSAKEGVGKDAPPVSDATWEEVQSHLDRANKSLIDMAPMYDSLQKHSFHAVCGHLLKGRDHYAELKHASRSIPMVHKLLTVIASRVKHMLEKPLDTVSVIKMDKAGAADWQTSAQTAAANQLRELSRELRKAQREMHQSFLTRRKITPLPHMPVPWPAMRDAEEGGGEGYEEDSKVSSMRRSGMSTAIGQILSFAVGGKNEAAVNNELEALVEGRQCAMAEAVDRALVGILLYVAEQITGTRPL